MNIRIRLGNNLRRPEAVSGQCKHSETHNDTHTVFLKKKFGDCIFIAHGHYWNIVGFPGTCCGHQSTACAVGGLYGHGLILA